jgi:hypothetical protein
LLFNPPNVSQGLFMLGRTGEKEAHEHRRRKW